jgi:hypothetical protein
MKPDLVLKHGPDGALYLRRWNLRYKAAQALLSVLHFFGRTAWKWERGEYTPTRFYRIIRAAARVEKHHTSRSALLHNISGPDPDRALHNHPWPAFAIVLWGGYDQLVSARPTDWRVEAQVRRVERVETVRFLNILRVDEYHRIIRVRPNTWTITFTGKLLWGGWGFLVNGQHVDHKPYLGYVSQDDQ